MEQKKKQAKIAAAKRLQSSLRGIDKRHGTMYQQVYDRLAQMINSRALAPGSRVPPSRFLAEQLALSRATVAYAYDLLAADGYITGHGSAGTFVLGQPLATQAEAAPVSADASEGPVDWCQRNAATARLAVGVPPIDLFPRKVWSQLLKRRANRLKLADLETGDPQGLAALRRAIANRLAITRGIHCSAEQIFITAGAQGAASLIAASLLKPGDAVIAEDPMDSRLTDAVARAGVKIVRAAVDAEGIQFNAGRAMQSRARMAVTTAGCQFPMGVPLSASRRQALLKWAAAAQGWVVEHDYQSDFRFEGAVIPSLMSQDPGNRTIFVSHLSELLFPGLAISCIAVPVSCVARFRDAASQLSTAPGAADQDALIEMVRRGHIVRFTAHAHAVCATRRTVLARLLRDAGFEVYMPPLGLNLIARSPVAVTAAALQTLRSQGIAVVPLAALSAGKADARAEANTLVVGFGSTPVALMGNAVEVLKQAIG